MVRDGSTISRIEKDWVAKRHQETDNATTDFLNRAGMVGFDVGSFMDGYSPNIGIAFSGGGYRAMLNGAGVFKAFDSRTPGSTNPAQMGGLVQSATYISGLSGGSWLVGSIFVNNFTTVQDLQNSSELWDLSNSVLAPEGFTDLDDTVDTVEYYEELHKEVTSKQDAGFDISLTDYWGRALATQLISGDGGPAVTFSSIAKTDQFQNYEMPFPIIIADQKNPGQDIVSTNSTIYEFNPLEMGSFDPTLSSFTPLAYIGSPVAGGVPDNASHCTRGFDNAGFLLGTSSSLFNVALLQLESSSISGILRRLAENVLNELSDAETDTAIYSPNPFYKVKRSVNPAADSTSLTLVDGGLDGQNIPLEPLIQPSRNLDVVFAVDSSADTTTNWPNGTSLVATYARSLLPMQNYTDFPAIPDVNTFINLGLNTRPTFFGCNATNITHSPVDENSILPPLIIYLSNYPYTYMSNTSTFQMKYDSEERDAIIENGYNVATMGNGTVDQEWPACAACAIVRRGEEKRGLNQTDQCQRCFTKYCWDGTRNETDPGEVEYSVLTVQNSAGTRSDPVGWKAIGIVVIGAVAAGMM